MSKLPPWKWKPAPFVNNTSRCFFPPQVCLRSPVLLPTGNQVCYCCHGSSSPEALPCRCAGHTGHTGVIFTAPRVAFQPRYIITSKLLCTRLCFVILSVLTLMCFLNPPPPNIYSPSSAGTISPLRLWHSPLLLWLLSLTLCINRLSCFLDLSIR